MFFGSLLLFLKVQINVEGGGGSKMSSQCFLISFCFQKNVKDEDEDNFVFSKNMQGKLEGCSRLITKSSSRESSLIMQN